LNYELTIAKRRKTQAGKGSNWDMTSNGQIPGPNFWGIYEGEYAVQ